MFNLVTNFCLLPLILPTWKEKPLPKDFLSYEAAGFKSPSAKVQFQKNALKNNDPTFRIQVLQQLAQINNDESQALIYSHLKKEKNSSVRLALLNALCNCKASEGHMKEVESLITSELAEGIAAARLYCGFPKADLKRVVKLMDVLREADQLILLQALNDSARLPLGIWMNLYKKRKEPRARFLILQALTSKAGNPQSLKLLADVLKSPKLLERSAVALNLKPSTKTAELIKVLATDKHSSIRSLAAQNMGLLVNSDFHPILLKLAKDKDSEVRKKAYSSLRKYPTKATLNTLVDGFADVELLNQKVACESVQVISTATSVAQTLASYIQDKNIGKRRWSAKVLGFLNKKEFAGKIKQQLLREKNHDAQKEQLFALGEFKELLNDKQIKKLFIGHKRVKAELMHYLGKTNRQEFFHYIHDAAFNEKGSSVCHAAFEAIGRNGSTWFNKTILAVMNDLDSEDTRSSYDRVCACWAAGKLRGLSKAARERLVKSVSEKTLPSPMGKAFDGMVMIPILFAFVDQAKFGDGDRDYYKKKIASFVKRFKQTGSARGRSSEFPTGYEKMHYADQAVAYLEGKDIEAAPNKKRSIVWRYKDLSDK